jgi:hypothetical protein
MLSTRYHSMPPFTQIRFNIAAKVGIVMQIAMLFFDAITISGRVHFMLDLFGSPAMSYGWRHEN